MLQHHPVQALHVRISDLQLRADRSIKDIKMRPALRLAAGFVNRPNNVPHYQKLFQTHDGLRQWEKTPRSKAMLYPYYALMGVTFSGCTYMMCRMVLGHKTWFGKD